MNKLFSNEDKIRFILFHKPQYRDAQPPFLPAFKIKDYERKRSSPIEFLGILVNGNLICIPYLNTLLNKLSKILGLLYKSKSFLNAKAMKSSPSPFSW